MSELGDSFANVTIKPGLLFGMEDVEFYIHAFSPKSLEKVDGFFFNPFLCPSKSFQKVLFPHGYPGHQLAVK